LGIICQGKVSSKACFWDNQLNKVGQPIPRAGEFPLNTSFAAGEELDGGSGGTCTGCHAGENAYIVHPDDLAFDVPNLQPDNYYAPMVAATWPQNRTPNTKLAGVALVAGDRSCLSCHEQGDAGRLPEITAELAVPATDTYCDIV